MSSTHAATRRASGAALTLDSIVCGVDASRSDEEAVRQAATLAGAGGSLEVVCIAYQSGYGATAKAMLGFDRAERGLEEARAVAAELGVTAATRIETARDRWAGLAAAADGKDLLVLGRHRRSRAEGIIGGSVVTEALHRATIPVLVAHACATAFPERMLLATDGSADSRRAARLAALVASRHGQQVTVLTVGTEVDRGHRYEIAEEAADVFRASGVEPVTVLRHGSPADAIVRFAEESGASLVALGSGGKLGFRALGSVSEQVAHRVLGSVLVARPPTAST